jgi:hypothetical protein
MFTYRQSFPIFFKHHIVFSITASSLERSYIEYTLMTSHIYRYVIDLRVFESGEVQVLSWSIKSKWMFRCMNSVFLTIRVLDVAKFTLP